MRNPCTRFSSEDISRFVDHELPKETCDIMEQHLAECPECRALAESFASMSSIFSDRVNHRVQLMERTDMHQRLYERLEKEKESTGGTFFGVLGRHMHLKAASVLMILVISIFTFQNMASSPEGPSAIVKSVDTDFASVMIIETQKEKHTIIWFNET